MKIIASRSLYFSFFLSTLLILSSCASTRTITPLTQSNRSKIKKIAILVEADEEINVSVSKKKAYWSDVLGWFVLLTGGLATPVWAVSMMTEYGVRTHIDEKHEESLEAKLIHFHPGELMTEKLKNYLELSNAGFTAEIPEVNSPSMLKAKGFDTILEVNLKEWEFKLCPRTSWSAPDLEPEEREALNKWNKLISDRTQSTWAPHATGPFFKKGETKELERLEPVVKRIYSDKVNVWFKLSGKMSLIDDNTTVWERKELYKDENCYPLVDLKTQPELIVDILTRAIQNLAENTVNEILYTRTHTHLQTLAYSHTNTRTHAHTHI